MLRDETLRRRVTETLAAGVAGGTWCCDSKKEGGAGEKGDAAAA
jgi:hypothetical protein